jgi:hypothetical protein
MKGIIENLDFYGLDKNNCPAERQGIQKGLNNDR